MAAADVVISIGCDVKELPPGSGSLRRWDEVPPPSEDLSRAEQLIRERVIQLVDELLRKQGR
jgi:hypothetical protein